MDQLYTNDNNILIIAELGMRSNERLGKLTTVLYFVLCTEYFVNTVNIVVLAYCSFG